jgi:hypothetical protein
MGMVSRATAYAHYGGANRSGVSFGQNRDAPPSIGTKNPVNPPVKKLKAKIIETTIEKPTATARHVACIVWFGVIRGRRERRETYGSARSSNRAVATSARPTNIMARNRNGGLSQGTPRN